MMHVCHLSTAERAALLAIVSRVGAVEVLRTVAQTIAVNHPDVTSGDRYRTKLNAIAAQLQAEPWGDARDHSDEVDR